MQERRNSGADCRSDKELGRSRSLFPFDFLFLSNYLLWYGASSPKEDDVQCSG